MKISVCCGEMICSAGLTVQAAVTHPSAVCSGWISSISMINTNLSVAVVMMVVAGFFTVCAVLAVILLQMVRVSAPCVRFRVNWLNWTNTGQNDGLGISRCLLYHI